LDSSAILSGKPIDLNGRIVIPESVEKEVMREDPKLFDLIQMGESRRLSKVDKEVIAVALDNMGRGDVCIITDDYSIQNVASFLGFFGIEIQGFVGERNNQEIHLEIQM